MHYTNRCRFFKSSVFFVLVSISLWIWHHINQVNEKKIEIRALTSQKNISIISLPKENSNGGDETWL